MDGEEYDSALDEPPTLPTLDEFIAQARAKDWPNNSYVAEPRLRELYVRLTHFRGRETLEIGRVLAEEPGKGAFRALVARLRAQYPTLPIFVENVLSRRFARGLRRLKFKQVDRSENPSFVWDPFGRYETWLEPEEKLDDEVQQWLTSLQQSHRPTPGTGRA
jgi:hypothetical protein